MSPKPSLKAWVCLTVCIRWSFFLAKITTIRTKVYIRPGFKYWFFYFLGLWFGKNLCIYLWIECFISRIGMRIGTVYAHADNELRFKENSKGQGLSCQCWSGSYDSLFVRAESLEFAQILQLLTLWGKRYENNLETQTRPGTLTLLRSVWGVNRVITLAFYCLKTVYDVNPLSFLLPNIFLISYGKVYLHPCHMGSCK